MKTYEIPWSVGSMFICNKCGKSFNKTENAENLKSELRTYLKENDNHKKIRVMVSGCLSVCIKEEQTVMYQNNLGKTDIFTVDKDFDAAEADLKKFLDKRL